jgi:hypothetical protein
MATPILDSHPHYCFHSPICNVHHHPDLHHCHKQHCPGAISPEMAKQAGLMDEDGEISCPLCGCETTLNPGKRLAEVHVQLCTDDSIHYPEMHKAGTISHEDYAAWKATLTRDELLGRYKRVPDIHVLASFTHEETTLMDSDLPAFNVLLLDRVNERAESALLHQVPHRHKTTSVKLSIPHNREH